MFKKQNAKSEAKILHKKDTVAKSVSNFLRAQLKQLMVINHGW